MKNKNRFLNSISNLPIPFPDDAGAAGSAPADTATGGTGDAGAEGAGAAGGEGEGAAPLSDAEKIEKARGEGEGTGEGEAGTGSEDEGEGEGADDKSGEGEGEGGKEGATGETSEDERTVPENPDDYDFTLPDVGLKNEKGEPFQFEKDDPFVARMREIAHADGISQKGLSDALKLYAEVQKDTQSAIEKNIKDTSAARMTEEMGKLTHTDKNGKEIAGEDRVKALLTSLEAAGGADLRADLVPGIVNSKVVIALEKLVGLASEGKIGEGKPNTQTDLDGLSGEALLDKLRS